MPARDWRVGLFCASGDPLVRTATGAAIELPKTDTIKIIFWSLEFFILVLATWLLGVSTPSMVTMILLLASLLIPICAIFLSIVDFKKEEKKQKVRMLREPMLHRFLPDLEYELTNAFATIRDHLDLLIDEYPDLVAMYQERLGSIRRATDRICQAVEALVVMRRFVFNKEDKQEVDVRLMMNDAVEAVRSSHSIKGISLTMANGGARHALVYRRDFAIMLQHLIACASHGVSSGKSVTVSLETDDGGENFNIQANVHSESFDENSPEMKSSATTTWAMGDLKKGFGGNVGLQMALVCAIAEGHGGTLEVKSYNGYRTQMAVILPL